MTTVDDDTLASLQTTLHAARKVLAEAYDRRDRIAGEIAATETGRGAVVLPELLMVLGAAEHALALAAESATTPITNTGAIP